MEQGADKSIIEHLQRQILKLQGGQAHKESAHPIGLGLLEAAFPGGIFTRGAVHELISNSSEAATCTSGFISVVLNKLMPKEGCCVWVSTVPRRSIYAPALKTFGVDPERILFVDAANQQQTLWVLEEALKCASLSAVVGELTELNFNDSRRLQLAVEKSQVTGFVHRFRPKTENAVACVSRWKVTPAASTLLTNSGVGFANWQVQLLKVRSGQPGEWQVEWSPGGLSYKVAEKEASHTHYTQETA